MRVYNTLIFNCDRLCCLCSIEFFNQNLNYSRLLRAYDSDERLQQSDERYDYFFDTFTLHDSKDVLLTAFVLLTSIMLVLPNITFINCSSESYYVSYIRFQFSPVTLSFVL
jgi:hypothetical protein